MKLDDFKPLTIAKKEMFDSFLRKYPQESSEYLLTTLISWGHYTPAHVTVRDGRLIIMTMKDGKPYFRPPIGEKDVRLLRDLLDLCRHEGGEMPLVGVEKGAKEWIGSVHPGIVWVADTGAFDYVYLTDDLARLAGQGYRIQRGHVNRFRKSYRYSVEEVSRVNAKDVDDFLKRWCAEHGCDENHLLEAEVTALKYCMANFSQLGLSGIAIRIDGGIQALAVYEPLGADTASIHFEKGIQGYEGIYPAINNETAMLLSGRFKYLNRQSDLGVPGLRTAKERLHPHHMVELYCAKNDSLPA
jgi:uncharacterized protein